VLDNTTREARNVAKLKNSALSLLFVNQYIYIIWIKLSVWMTDTPSIDG